MALPTAAQHPSDEALVRDARAGDRGAFTLLVERYGGAILAAVRARLGREEGALDVVQETWVRVARGLGTFRDGATFRPWLFAVAFNTLRDAGRREARRPAVEGADDALESIGRSDTEGARLAERELIEGALAQVPEPYRTAVHTVDVLGLDHGEAAGVLDCAPGTLKSRLHRGRRIFCDHYLRLSGAARDRAPEGGARG